MPGVIYAKVNARDWKGEVLFADWIVSEEEILDEIAPRFSSSVYKRDECTYDLGFELYCCDDKCYKQSGLREELS
jgi:hypothetical protein